MRIVYLLDNTTTKDKPIRLCQKRDTHVLTDNKSTREVWPVTVAILMTIVAFSYAVKNTHNLQWPAEVDFFRDMGAVQSILENKGAADSLFYDEVRWYNPAVPTLVAWVVEITKLPLNTVYAQIGPYLNLLGPVTFFIFCRLLIGNWAAVFALSAYLFLGNHSVVTWHQATYSAWAWPWNVAQGMFFLSASVILSTYRSSSYLWAVFAGLLLGLTLLFHTAPAFILTLLVSAFSLKRIVQANSSAERRRQIALYFIIGITSFLVALPFLGPLAVEYGFVIKNREPTKYVAIGFRDVIHYCFNIRFVVFVLMAALLWLKPERTRLSASIITELKSIVVLVVALLIVAFAIQFLRAYNIDLPQLYPSFHFHIYFKVIEAVMFGLGVCVLSGALVSLVTGSKTLNPHNDVRGLALSVTLVLIYLAMVFPSYTKRMDFVGTKTASVQYAEKTDEIILYNWLLANTSIDDVFLARDDARLISVSAAGRKVIVHGGMFTSPYLDFEQRVEDEKAFYNALSSKDLKTIRSLAAFYSLDYVVLNKQLDVCCVASMKSMEDFERVFVANRYDVYRYKPQN